MYNHLLNIGSIIILLLLLSASLHSNLRFSKKIVEWKGTKKKVALGFTLGNYNLHCFISGIFYCSISYIS